MNVLKTQRFGLPTLIEDELTMMGVVGLDHLIEIPEQSTHIHVVYDTLKNKFEIEFIRKSDEVREKL